MIDAYFDWYLSWVNFWHAHPYALFFFAAGLLLALGSRKRR